MSASNSNSLTSTAESDDIQGSSMAKVLADYATMQSIEQPLKGAAASAEQSVPATQERKNEEPMPREIGGRDGPEPTRFGDWEKAGRCIDF